MFSPLKQHIPLSRIKETNSTVNKQLQKDLKQLIFKLDSNQIISLFKNLQHELGVQSIQEFAKNGVLCNYCHIQFDTFNCKGYGRNQNQALVNAIKNILQTMISSSYKIQYIKRALKTSVRSNKKPIITQSSKKSSKKVQDLNVNNLQMNKLTKRNLDYKNMNNHNNLRINLDNNENKQNISKKMNQTLDLNSSFNYEFNIKEKNFDLDMSQINVQKGTVINRKQRKSFNTIFNQKPAIISQSQAQVVDQPSLKQQQKCQQINCIYYDIHKNSQRQIRGLNARIKLLQEQNSMLKAILLKDFNKQFFKNQNQLNNNNKDKGDKV